MKLKSVGKPGEGCFGMVRSSSPDHQGGPIQSHVVFLSSADVSSGKYVSPRSKLAKTDTLIHGGSKRKWVIVDPATIPPSVIEELRSSKVA